MCSIVMMTEHQKTQSVPDTKPLRAVLSNSTAQINLKKFISELSCRCWNMSSPENTARGAAQGRLFNHVNQFKGTYGLCTVECANCNIQSDAVDSTDIEAFMESTDAEMSFGNFTIVKPKNYSYRNDLTRLNTTNCKYTNTFAVIGDFLKQGRENCPCRKLKYVTFTSKVFHDQFVQMKKILKSHDITSADIKRTPKVSEIRLNW